MIYTIAKAISNAFHKILKFFMNTDEDIRPKDMNRCAAAEKEDAAPFIEAPQDSEECAAEFEHAAIPVLKEMNEEREHASLSHSVAEAHSPSHTKRTTRCATPKKRKMARKNIPKPIPQDVLNKLLLARRKLLFKKCTFKIRTSNASSKKRKLSPQEMSKEKILEKRRIIFKKYTKL